jgi:chromosome segregation ATPase
MRVQDIKQGNRVVYAIGGVEYNAVALGSPSFGNHPGLQAFNYHLNLAYLNEQGTPIKIYGAPLLTVAQDDDAKAEILAAEVRVKPALVVAPEDADKAEKLSAAKENEQAQAKRIADAPVTIGWRPEVDDEAVAALKSTIAQYKVSLDKAVEDLKAANDKLTEANGKLASFDDVTKQLADARAHIGDQNALISHVQGELAEAEEKVDQLTAELAAATAPVEPKATEHAGEETEQPKV